MFVSIDKESSTPPSEQLALAIIYAIRTKEVSEGQRLPSVRQMANDLGVAPNTVVRAYRMLEEDGWVTSVKRRGIFVASPLPAQSDPVVGLHEAAEDFLAKAMALGFSPAEAISALQEIYSADIIRYHYSEETT